MRRESAAPIGSEELGDGALLRGHRIDLVRNGSIFPALVDAIGRARTSIHILMYIWRPGHASDQLVEALVARRRAGVAVRVLVDAVGSRRGFTSSVLPVLEEAGCEVRLFRSPRGEPPSGMISRNHRKIVVVDGGVAFVGGWCVWDKFLGEGLAEDAWRDTNARLEGPAVAQAQAAFLEDWAEAGGAPIPCAQLPEPGPSSGDAWAQIVATSARGAEGNGLSRALFSLARERLWIASGYFAPPDRDLQLLCARAREGVDVRLLVAGPVHDVPPVREAGRATFPALIAAGAHVYEYQPSMLHAKTIVVDDSLCAVGSLNLEPTSLKVLEECVAIFWSRELAAELARDFKRDLQHSRQVAPPGLVGRALMPPRRALRRGLSTLAAWARRRRRAQGEVHRRVPATRHRPYPGS